MELLLTDFNTIEYLLFVCGFSHLYLTKFSIWDRIFFRYFFNMLSFIRAIELNIFRNVYKGIGCLYQNTFVFLLFTL